MLLHGAANAITSVCCLAGSCLSSDTTGNQPRRLELDLNSHCRPCSVRFDQLCAHHSETLQQRAPSSPAQGASHPCWQCPRRSWPCHMPRQSLRGGAQQAASDKARRGVVQAWQASCRWEARRRHSIAGCCPAMARSAAARPLQFYLQFNSQEKTSALAAPARQAVGQGNRAGERNLGLRPQGGGRKQHRMPGTHAHQAPRT